MAWLEKDRRTGVFKVVLRLSGRKLKRSVDTRNRDQALAVCGTVKDTLNAINRGWVTVPEGVDVGDFLVTGGKVVAKPTVQRTLTLAKLFAEYFDSLPDGSLEESTISGMRIHERHLYRILKKSFPIQKLTLTDLQRYVDRRSKDDGLRGRKVTPTTIRKAIVTLRTAWNWATKNGLLVGRFPHDGLKYPKPNEKPPFQTWQEIEQQIARGGLTEAEQGDLWDCLFLTLPEISELLAYVKKHARHPFIYPMFALAAHTGARRSEIVRCRLNDIDLTAGVITIHERKRNQSMRTTRRVPISPYLAAVLHEWTGLHPGGQNTFCLNGDVQRSKKQRCGSVPVTRDEVHDHFKRTLAGSKWEKLKGWHVFRHSFCSNCAAAGVDQRIINTWVGHQTEDMVRRYRHLIPNQEQVAIQKVFGVN